MASSTVLDKKKNCPKGIIKAEMENGYKRKVIFQETLSIKNSRKATLKLNFDCHTNRSHKGKGGGYLRLYLTVKKSSDGSIVGGYEEEKIKSWENIHGDYKPSYNGEIASFDYSYDVEFHFKIVANTGEYSAHIWGGQNTISVIRYMAISVEYGLQ